MIIPKDKKWVQVNGSEVMGNLWASFNIDLSDNYGRLRIGQRLIVNTDETDDADIGVPVAFASINSINYCIAGSKVFKSGANTPNSNFTEDAISGVPTNLNSLYSDMASFNGYLYVSANSTSVYKTDGVSWSSFSAGSNTGSPRLFVQYADRMYMTDGNAKIISWSTSDTPATSGAYTLDLSSNADTRRITCMRASASRIWIFTTNLSGGKALVYEWDGASTQPTRSYRLESSGAFSCVIKDDIPWIIDANANLLAWNGGTFQYITGFNRENHKLLTGIFSTTNDRFVHPNGMSIVEGNIHILINGSNNDNTGTIEDTIPSGIYEYQKEFGLVHKYSFGLTKSNGTIVDFGQIRISKAGALSELNQPSTSSTRNGTFLAGAQIYTNAGSTRNVISYDDQNSTLQKAGTFITTKIQSSEVTEMWQKLYVGVKKFLNDNDKMIVKYRIEEVDSTQISCTWTSTNSFTTTSDISAYANNDEITVIQGVGSGKCAHITDLSESAGTYTVTVDETFTGATSQTFLAKIDKWKKIGSLSNRNASYLECPIGKSANWIQLKIWVTFTGRKEEIETLYLVSAPNQFAK